MKALTPIKSIRKKCLDCTCNQPREVRYCTVKDCALFPYRLGHRPKQQGETDEEETEEESTI